MQLLRSIILALPLMALGWLATLVAVGLLSDAAPGQVVLFPREDFVADLPFDAAVLGSNGWSVTLKSDEPALARALYRQGAGLPGCLPLPRSR